jgi:hypothetical protein
VVDIEVITVTVTMIEGAPVVVPVALIDIGILITEINTMIIMPDSYSETIVQIRREITTVEEMTMISLPLLRRTPYLNRTTNYPRPNSVFVCRGYSKTERNLDNKHY